MAHRPPIVRQTNVPIAKQRDIELVAHCAEEGCQSIGRTSLRAVEENLTTPLQSDRLRTELVTLYIRQPQRARISGMGSEGAAAGRTNEHIGDVFEAADGLVPIEQSTDFTPHVSRRRSMCAHGAADQLERNIGDVQICEGTDFADAVNLRGPLVDVVDLDQADVEIDIDVLPRPPGIQVGKKFARQLGRCAGADRYPVAANDRVDARSRSPGDMTVCERVGLVSVSNQTGNRREMFLTLHVADDRTATAHNACRIIELRIAFLANVILLYLDHAQRHLLPVWHVHSRRHRVVGVGEIVWIDPAVNENKDRGPGIRPNLRICERTYGSWLGGSCGVAVWFCVAHRRIARPDAVPSDRRGDDVLLVHEMPVELLAGGEQIPKRQEVEI